MFVVRSLRVGVCLACNRECECFEVEAERLKLRGLLCAADFRRQVKLAVAVQSASTDIDPKPVATR